MRASKISIPLQELRFRVENDCLDPTSKGWFRKARYWDEAVVTRVKDSKNISLIKYWYSDIQQIRMPITREEDLNCLEYLRFLSHYHNHLDGLYLYDGDEKADNEEV